MTCVRAIAQAADHQRVAHRLHHVGGIVGGRAVDAEADGEPAASSSQVGQIPDASTMFEAAQWQTPTPALPSRAISSALKWMPWASQVAARHPAGFLQQFDRPQAIHLEAKSLFVRGLAQVGVKLAVVALREPRALGHQIAWRSRTANRARARRGFARPASDRGRASAPARCRPESSLRPAPRCPAADRRPFATGSSSRARPSCACRARRASSTSMSTAFSSPADRDSDDRRRWCSRTARARPARAATQAASWSRLEPRPDRIERGAARRTAAC